MARGAFVYCVWCRIGWLWCICYGLHVVHIAHYVLYFIMVVAHMFMGCGSYAYGVRFICYGAWADMICLVQHIVIMTDMLLCVSSVKPCGLYVMVNCFTTRNPCFMGCVADSIVAVFNVFAVWPIVYTLWCAIYILWHWVLIYGVWFVFYGSGSCFMVCGWYLWYVEHLLCIVVHIVRVFGHVWMYLDICCIVCYAYSLVCVVRIVGLRLVFFVFIDVWGLGAFRKAAGQIILLGVRVLWCVVQIIWTLIHVLMAVADV